jgi:putative membrane protein
MRLTALAVLAAAPAGALAHAEGDHLLGEIPLWISQALFALAWWAYLRAAPRKPPGPARAALFHAVMLLTGLTLFGPFDTWAATSTAWHMVQHMLLMVVAAPLLVMARPWPQWRRFFGPRPDPLWRSLAQLSRRPFACAVLHGAAIWVWHAPAPYMAAVQNTGWHVLEHACFLFTAVLFWRAVLHAGRNGTPNALLALLITLTHTGMLGALLTFAHAPLYGGESRSLQDQQIAGLVMWIPGGTVYLLAMAWIVLRWLDAKPGRTRAPA